MSGGSYNYGYSKIDELATHIRVEGQCSAARPALRAAFKDHLRLVAEACRAIEWNDSCDGDDRETELLMRIVSPKLELEKATSDAQLALLQLRAALERAEKALKAT